MSALTFTSNPARLRMEAAGKAYQNRNVVSARMAAEERRRRSARRIHNAILAVAHFRPAASVVDIVREICERERIDAREIISHRRPVNVTLARFEIWWRCRRDTTLSLTQLGRIFDRDHTTVLYGIRMHAKRMEGLGCESPNCNSHRSTQPAY